MTQQQLGLFILAALILTLVAAWLTRATARRIGGALAGSTVCGPVALGIAVLGERAGWWHMAIPTKPFMLALLWMSMAACGYIFLITWRIARRFGNRGLWAAAFIAAVIGPPRDMWYMARFPEWGYYAPGLAPILAIAAAYVVLGVAGHGVMRVVAGPAGADRLAREN